MKTITLKTPIQKVTPAVGSPEEGKRRLLRTLNKFSFDATPAQSIALASALLEAVTKSKKTGAAGRIRVSVKRTSGPSVAVVSTL